jgi:glycosyltransferase
LGPATFNWIRLATGDVIGIGVLHSDDFYADNYVIEDVVNQLKEKRVDSCYSALVYVDKNNTDKVIRYCGEPDRVRSPHFT